MPKSDGSKKVLACSCGYKEKDASKAAIIEELIKPSKELEIIEKEDIPLPTSEAHCGKCHNKTAYFWTVQTRAADEPETKFMKCTKCGHTWRDYS